MREAGIEKDDYNNKDIYAYQKKVEIENMIDPLKDKYKIIELNVKEFKRKQEEYFKRT
jgi:hypothetical protein